MLRQGRKYTTPDESCLVARPAEAQHWEAMKADRAARDAQRIAEIARQANTAGVRIVGVDGPSGAGKSTLARLVAAALDAPIVEIDDFVSWNDFGGWWPRFEAEVVRPLLDGRDATYRVRDWIGDQFGNGLDGWKTVRWQPYIVFEGVTCSRATVAGSLACRVWVETPPDERLSRGIARDGESHRPYWERWMVEEDLFFAADDTRSRADVLIDGTSDRTA
jgi:energy-coupling factor transporter ATP-binding protein EcfA2